MADRRGARGCDEGDQPAHRAGVRYVAQRQALGEAEIKEGHDMKLTHKFAEMTPDKRPQDPHIDGTGLRFDTMEHGGESRHHAAGPDRCRGSSCIYVPITQNGKVVDSQGYVIGPDVE